MDGLISCSNCESSIAKEYKYCPHCGQEQLHSIRLKHLFSSFLSDYFTFDSKIVRSLRPLLFKPGFLTLEYIAGRRVRYIPPLRMFIFLSIVFFLLLSLSSTNKISSVDESLLGINWDHFFESRLPKLFFVLLPLFALLVSALYKKQQKGLLTHFLFALHFHASVFLLGIIYYLISRVGIALGGLWINQIALASIGVYVAFYLWKALKEVYELKFWPTSFRFFLLVFFYILLLVALSVMLLAFSINQ